MSARDTPSVAPALSVVVVSFNGAAILHRCLEVLSPDAIRAGAEVIVVCNWQDPGGRDALERDYSHVRFVDAPDGMIVPRLRRVGMAASRGAIVAVIEDDCLVMPGWCDAILAAHRTADVAIGGAVEPGPYRRGIDWAVFFYEYGRFMQPLPARPTPDLAGNNVSYKRAALDELPLSDGFYDVFVHPRWAAEGRGLRADGTIVVHQVHFRTWSDVTTMPFHHGRGFAGARFPDAKLPTRLAASLLALFLPVLSTARIMKVVLERRRFGRLPRAFPWIFLFATSWSLGESAGYLLGPGDSLSRWR
jgi:hypothetical protein